MASKISDAEPFELIPRQGGAEEEDAYVFVEATDNNVADKQDDELDGPGDFVLTEYFSDVEPSVSASPHRLAVLPDEAMISSASAPETGPKSSPLVVSLLLNTEWQKDAVIVKAFWKRFLFIIFISVIRLAVSPLFINFRGGTMHSNPHSHGVVAIATLDDNPDAPFSPLVKSGMLLNEKRSSTYTHRMKQSPTLEKVDESLSLLVNELKSSVKHPENSDAATSKTYRSTSGFRGEIPCLKLNPSFPSNNVVADFARQTPRIVASLLEGAPQPGIVLSSGNPVLIPVRSLIPFAAPRRSSPPLLFTNDGDRINYMGVGKSGDRFIPVPTVVETGIPTLNNTHLDIATHHSDTNEDDGCGSNEFAFPLTAKNSKVIYPYGVHSKNIFEDVVRSYRKTGATKTADKHVLVQQKVRPVSVALTAATFHEFLREKRHVFVRFFYPCSSYDRLLVPVWNKFSKMCADIDNCEFATATVDCVAEPLICDEQEIVTVPTLRWFDHTAATFQDYKGRRAVKDLRKFARKCFDQDFRQHG